jgi:DNA-binding NarL/FixJ family response regulator
MLTIAIVDDHPVKRLGLEKVVSDAPGLTVGASVQNSDELDVEARFDAVFLELSSRTGLPVAPELLALSAHGPIVASAAWERPPMLGAVIRAKARGYVTSRSRGEVVVAALKAVGDGGFYVCPELVDRFFAEMGRSGAEEPSGLAPREVETLRWIARGLTHAQIANRMRLTEATVNTYAKRIRAKLNVGNKAELTRMAIELGHLPAEVRQFPAA